MANEKQETKLIDAGSDDASVVGWQVERDLDAIQLTSAHPAAPMMRPYHPPKNLRRAKLIEAYDYIAKSFHRFLGRPRNEAVLLIDITEKNAGPEFVADTWIITERHAGTVVEVLRGSSGLVEQEIHTWGGRLDGDFPAGPWPRATPRPAHAPKLFPGNRYLVALERRDGLLLPSGVEGTLLLHGDDDDLYQELEAGLLQELRAAEEL